MYFFKLFSFFFTVVLSKDERPRKVKILILEKLPEDNYQVLKYVVQFLSRVRNQYSQSRFPTMKNGSLHSSVSFLLLIGNGPMRLEQDDF